MSYGNPCRLRALQIRVVQQREGRQNRCTRRPPDGEKTAYSRRTKAKRRPVYTNVHRRLFMSYGNPCRLRALQICVAQQREGRRDRCARRPPEGEEDGVFTSNKSKKTTRLHKRTRSPFHVLRQSLPTESVADMRRTTARGATQCTQTYTVAPETGSKTQRCGAISRQKAYG